MFDVREGIPGLPGVDEFCDLRIAAGLSAMDRAATTLALPRSLHAVTIRDGDRLIGMGRVVGDGLHVQVTDIAVHPDHQGEGLAHVILGSIATFIATLPRSTIVTLFADVDWLYHKYDFVVPSASTGMMLKRHPDTGR